MNGTSCQGVGAREVSVSWVMVGATEPNVGQTPRAEVSGAGRLPTDGGSDGQVP